MLMYICINIRLQEKAAKGIKPKTWFEILKFANVLEINKVKKEKFQPVNPRTFRSLSLGSRWIRDFATCHCQSTKNITSSTEVYIKWLHLPKEISTAVWEFKWLTNTVGISNNRFIEYKNTKNKMVNKISVL